MILLTGASGFIGKHLFKALQAKYGIEQVVALTSQPIIGHYLLHNNYTFSSSFFAENGYAGIETVVHLGAYIPKSSIHVNHAKSCNNNIKTTSKILESQLPNLRKVVFASTVDIYDSSCTYITEKSPIAPASLYGLSKYYCERLVDVWANENKIVHQILRLGHVYGPGEENYKKIIPSTIKRLLTNQPIEIWGSGDELRAFIYIDDLIAAVLQSLELGSYVGPINVVSNNQISIKELIALLMKISGKSREILMKNESIRGRDYVFDSTKMKGLLLSNETPLDAGLGKEYDYMKGMEI